VKNFYILSTTDSKCPGPEVGTSGLCDNVRRQFGSMMIISFLAHSSYRNSPSWYTLLDSFRKLKKDQ